MTMPAGRAATLSQSRLARLNANSFCCMFRFSHQYLFLCSSVCLKVDSTFPKIANTFALSEGLFFKLSQRLCSDEIDKIVRRQLNQSSLCAAINNIESAAVSISHSPKRATTYPWRAIKSLKAFKLMLVFNVIVQTLDVLIGFQLSFYCLNFEINCKSTTSH